MVLWACPIHNAQQKGWKLQLCKSRIQLLKYVPYTDRSLNVVADVYPVPQGREENYLLRGELPAKFFLEYLGLSVLSCCPMCCKWWSVYTKFSGGSISESWILLLINLSKVHFFYVRIMEW